MNKKNTKNNRKGSILLGVLIIMLMIAAISVSILTRTAYDSKLAIISKDSHNAYQDSDAAAEAVIRKLKILDDNSSGKIPENVAVNDSSLVGCASGGERYCYDKDSRLISSSTVKLIDSNKNPVLFFVKQGGSSRDTMRAVMVPMPNRAANYLTYRDTPADDKTPTVSSDCDPKITFECGKNDSAKLEIRISESSDLDSGDWKKINESDFSSGYNDFDCSGNAGDEKSVVLKSSNFTSGKTYHFAIKRTNPNKLGLDSPYIMVNGSFEKSTTCL